MSECQSCGVPGRGGQWEWGSGVMQCMLTLPRSIERVKVMYDFIVESSHVLRPLSFALGWSMEEKFPPTSRMDKNGDGSLYWTRSTPPFFPLTLLTHYPPSAWFSQG